MTEEHPKPQFRAVGLLLAGGLLIGILMAILTVAWSGSTTSSSTRSSGLISITEPAAVGNLAPDFSAPMPDGRTLTIQELRGSPVALNFWATWCAPCRLEMPELQSAATRYADQGLVVLGVNAAEPPEQVKAFMDELELTFPTVIDETGRIAVQYGVYAFPTTVWIDAQGIIRARHIGPLTTKDIDRYVADLLDR